MFPDTNIITLDAHSERYRLDAEIAHYQRVVREIAEQPQVGATFGPQARDLAYHRLVELVETRDAMVVA